MQTRLAYVEAGFCFVAQLSRGGVNISVLQCPNFSTKKNAMIDAKETTLTVPLPFDAFHGFKCLILYFILLTALLNSL